MSVRPYLIEKIRPRDVVVGDVAYDPAFTVNWLLIRRVRRYSCNGYETWQDAVDAMNYRLLLGTSWLPVFRDPNRLKGGAA